MKKLYAEAKREVLSFLNRETRTHDSIANAVTLVAEVLIILWVLKSL